VTVHIPDRFLPQIVIALEHRVAYLNAARRDPIPFEEIIQEPQRKASHEVPAAPAPESRRRNKRRGRCGAGRPAAPHLSHSRHSRYSTRMRCCRGSTLRGINKGSTPIIDRVAASDGD
jgi:hypothetical protein